MNEKLPGVLTRLETQTAVARILATAGSLADIREKLLEAIGSGLRWDVGIFWSPVEGELRPTAVWTRGAPQLAEFAEFSRGLRFVTGEGLPGRVFGDGRTAWVTDVLAEPDYPRRDAARASRIRSAIAFPVLMEGVCEVIEFSATRRIEVDDTTVEWLEAIGSQIAQFISRERAEETLRESEARFRVFAESASDAIFTIDSASTILYVNPAVERMFGWPADDLLGKPLTTLIPPELRASHDAGIRRYLESGRRNIPWTGVELPGLHRDGSHIPLEISFGEYEREGQRYFTGIARDISDRVRHQNELEKSTQQLEKLVGQLRQRTQEAEAALRARSDFIAMVSHELRTPLNAIIGFADLLVMGIPERLSDKPLDQVRRIRSAAAHLLALIEEVLTFSRSESGEDRVKLGETDAVAIVRDVATFVKPLAREKGLALHIRGAEDEIVMTTDAVKLRQILLNLLTNAVKFTDRGSVELQIAESDGMIEFKVCDTGVGIAPEHIAHIYEPFWQVEDVHTRRAGGTGIGLTVVKRLSDLLGGDIEVESEVGKGTRFTLRIPRTRNADAK